MMYLNILKKDLKRKKAMNLILLVFIILASMFVSSSVNNIITITTALDTYFDKAGIPDYMVATMNKVGGNSISEKLGAMEVIDDYAIEHILYASRENFRYRGEKPEGMNNTSLIMSFADAKLNFFDEKDNILKEVKPGTIWISGKFIRQNDMNIGDTIEIQYGDISGTYEVAGSFKDAFLGSPLMGMTRFILNEEDFEKFCSDEELSFVHGGSLCYITTDDAPAVEKELGNTDDSSLTFMGDRAMIKTTYVYDIIVAGVLLVLSVCLIIIAFVMLKFTINFTMAEEFREIGVMKAIGISDVKIRRLYMVKYLALAAVGSCVGFLLSIPFGNMLLESVSQSMVMEAKSEIMTNLICSLAVVGIIFLFCVLCTRKVKKFTPIDAIRNGMTGERFTKKGCLHLEKSPLRPAGFMALNDVLSNPKRFGIVILAFAVSLLLVLIVANTSNTLKNDTLVPAFGMTKCDVCVSDEGEIMRFMQKGGRELMEESLADMERVLAENGMPAKCCNEVLIKLGVSHGDNNSNPITLLGIGTTTDQYVYEEGTPPQNEGEVALTRLTAEKLGVSIGDTVTVNQLEGVKECMVTALYQSMNTLGEGMRLHESAGVDFGQAGGALATQIAFTDNPDRTEIAERIERIQKLYENARVYSIGEYVSVMTGTEGMLERVLALVLMLTIIVIILITVLMEQSFIAKERGEIAILKAVGFRDKVIIRWHTLRFGIAAAAAVILALIFELPLTRLAVDPIFRIMGADYGVEYTIIPIEVYVLYPLIILAVTLLSAFIAAHSLRKIRASESSGIE